MAGEADLGQILTELLNEFDRRNAQYALAGGWAFSALVEPRATTDIDILILLDSPSRENDSVPYLLGLYVDHCPFSAHEAQGYFDLALYWNPRESRDRGRPAVGRFRVFTVGSCPEETDIVW